MPSLILVDIQNDFLPGGALAVPRGDEVIEVANRMAEAFDFVVATQDWHPPDHGSFAANHPGHEVGDVIMLHGLEQVLWPVHCVQGTPGAELAPSLRRDAINEIVTKGGDPQVDSYSGFFDNGRRHPTRLHDLLQLHEVEVVYVLGLATDYCVKATACDAAELGYRVRLVTDGCRGVDLAEGDVEAALNAMVEAGVEMTTSAAVTAT